MIKLGVNLDHVATIREARKAVEPSPVSAVAFAELGGADSITVHLREDERHIKHQDVQMIRQIVRTKLNLEMSITQDIVEKALKISPEQVTLVPERREEITTEAGLDVIKNADRLKSVIREFHKADIAVSLFIDPDPELITQSKELGADFIEIHTGAYANAQGEKASKEMNRIIAAANQCQGIRLGFNAGHGLNYTNIYPFLKIKNLNEVNIGHSIISRAVFVGLTRAVGDMKNILLSAGN
jgi:pyridoxine 5-phosphate synthase